MTSPDNTNGTSSAVLPQTMPVTTDVQTQNARPVGLQAGAKPIEAPRRDGLNGFGDQSTPTNDAESAKRNGQATTGGQNSGGGGLRRAVAELVASVECLCVDSSGKEAAGAKRHLELAKGILESVRENAPRGVQESRTPAAFSAVRTDGMAGTPAQGPQRPTR